MKTKMRTQNVSPRLFNLTENGLMDGLKIFPRGFSLGGGGLIRYDGDAESGLVEGGHRLGGARDHADLPGVKRAVDRTLPGVDDELIEHAVAIKQNEPAGTDFFQILNPAFWASL